jgi:hypothetical protein
MTNIEKGWPVRTLWIVLYPFTAAAVAINLFMLGLMGQALGLTALSPVSAIWISIPLGVPAAWLAARWVRRLMDEADGTGK